MSAYIDLQICVQEELELEALVSLVAHIHHCLQAVFRQRHAVLQAEVKRPCLARLLRKTRAVETKVKLDRIRVESIL